MISNETIKNRCVNMRRHYKEKYEEYKNIYDEINNLNNDDFIIGMSGNKKLKRKRKRKEKKHILGFMKSVNLLNENATSIEFFKNSIERIEHLKKTVLMRYNWVKCLRDITLNKQYETYMEYQINGINIHGFDITNDTIKIIDLHDKQMCKLYNIGSLGQQNDGRYKYNKLILIGESYPSSFNNQCNNNYLNNTIVLARGSNMKWSIFGCYTDLLRPFNDKLKYKNSDENNTIINESIVKIVLNKIKNEYKEENINFEIKE